MDLRRIAAVTAAVILLSMGCGAPASEDRRPEPATSEEEGRVIMVRQIAPEGPAAPGAVIEITVELDAGGVTTVSQKAGTGRRFAVGDEVRVISRPDGRTWLEQ